MDTKYTPFNFDEWMQLAKEDPESFERQRTAVIKNIINTSNAVSRQRLDGLQWQIDRLREQSKTPMAACLNISKLMWDNLHGEEGLIDALNQLTGKTPIRQKVTSKADVIAIKRQSVGLSEKLG